MVKINPDDGKYTQQALFALILRFTYLIKTKYIPHFTRTYANIFGGKYQLQFKASIY